MAAQRSESSTCLNLPETVGSLGPEEGVSRNRPHAAGGIHGKMAPPRRSKYPVCVMVRDEAADLPRCLASLASGTDGDIVVVDTGSADGTPELAAAAGARYPHGRATGGGSAT